MLQQCIEQGKKYKKTVIAGTLSLLLIVTTSIATLYWQQQPEEFMLQEPTTEQAIAKEEPKKPSATEVSPVKNELGLNEQAIERGSSDTNPYQIGDIATAEVQYWEGQSLYTGKIINIYPETGTVLEYIGAGYVKQFNYTHVIDINATLEEDTYDEEEPKVIDQNIRAVLDTNNEIKFLRRSDEPRGGVGYRLRRYKIIDMVESPEKKSYETLSHNTCPIVPQYVADFVKEVISDWNC